MANDFVHFAVYVLEELHFNCGQKKALLMDLPKVLDIKMSSEYLINS